MQSWLAWVHLWSSRGLRHRHALFWVQSLENCFSELFPINQCLACTGRDLETLPKPSSSGWLSPIGEGLGSCEALQVWRTILGLWCVWVALTVGVPSKLAGTASCASYLELGQPLAWPYWPFLLLSPHCRMPGWMWVSVCYPTEPLAWPAHPLWVGMDVSMPWQVGISEGYAFPTGSVENPEPLWWLWRLWCAHHGWYD